MSEAPKPPVKRAVRGTTTRPAKEAKAKPTAAASAAPPGSAQETQPAPSAEPPAPAATNGNGPAKSRHATSGGTSVAKPAQGASHGSGSHRGAPAPKRVSEGYTDEKFLTAQRRALDEERRTYVEQARSLRAEADSLVEEMEPGDIQFDEESGEGGTVTVDRERDLALSAQALLAVEEIDHALAKIDHGTYGICENCGSLIPKNRLEALPYARLCIACKSGGLSRR